MSKPRLIRIGWTDFHSSYFEWILSEYFTLENYNTTVSYPKDCIFLISRAEYWNDSIKEKYLDQGHKLILANPWEARPFFLAEQFTPYLNNILLILGCKNSYDYGWKNILNVPRWFWYNESLWYTCESKMQFQNYVPNRTNDKLFFMPINRDKQFRTQIVERFEDLLDSAIWSYAQRFMNGKHLEVSTNNPVANIGWDRQFEESWYNNTYFSVVVESNVNSEYDLTRETNNLRSESVPCELFVTEKTFKPIAFQHPFQVCGMKGVLKFIKDNGFETFDHIFDESYDQQDFFENRLDIIYNNIKNFDVNNYLDPLTEQKIRHNYNRFYNRAVVLEGVKTDLIQPILEWKYAT